MFYKISLIIIAISFFSLNCKGNTDINRKDASTATSLEKKMDKKDTHKNTIEKHDRASLQANNRKDASTATSLEKKVEYKKEGIIYKYNDGNGNLYIITQNKIIYDPIPKHMTSTGFTDNGKRINKEITKENYSKIAGEYKKLFENKKIHTDKRLMMTGIIKIEDYTNEKNSKKALISNGTEKKELEKLLKSLL